MERDKTIIDFNVFTGEFDLVRSFNPNRIITHMFNQAGNPLKLYDPVTGLYMDLGPMVVTDNAGNVVTV